MNGLPLIRIVKYSIEKVVREVGIIRLMMGATVDPLILNEAGGFIPEYVNLVKFMESICNPRKTRTILDGKTKSQIK